MAQKTIGIIGGGLSGLCTAYYLKRLGIESTILEARPRLGGRILTDHGQGEAPVELGATWLGKKHISLNLLLKELKLEIFEQFMGDYAVYDPISTSPPQLVTMPYNPDPTFRIQGGTSTLIAKLAEHLSQDQILLNQKVRDLIVSEHSVTVKTENNEFSFDAVVTTLPPKLLLNSVNISPELPQELVEIGQNTHTWMSESIKVALTYSTPFWKQSKSIGSIFSNTGIISEMYDHCNYEDSKFALKGFINGGFAYSSQEERKRRVLAQLTDYFGSQVNEYISYKEKVWRTEPFTHYDYDGFILPHQNNGSPIFQSTFFNGKLFVGGSETASEHPGYMDGAVVSAKKIADQIRVHSK